MASSLQDAIVTGDVERVRLEIARGADVNEADLVLGLPLMIAAQGDHIAIAEVLVTHGANVNAEDITGTPLHTAALAGHTAMVEFLVSMGADVNASASEGTTPLHRAAANGHTDIIELLIKHGAARPTPLMALPRHGGAAGADQEVEVAAGVGLGDVLGIELGPAARV